MKHRLTDGSGYLEIDHSDSPGISESDVPSRLRNDTLIVPGGQRFETDIQMCSHCQRGIVLNPQRTRARAYCPNCDHYICDSCESARVIAGCVPFKSILEKQGG